ncbi:MAG: hypothetical protein HJJLKODD_01212 [Phycisphaerae bacterium]|nr:hypothetical protein [Phycisphaerae bacterium]
MVDKYRGATILNYMVKDRSAGLDRLFRALAHPVRRTMLRRLAGGERNLTELAKPLKMSFPAVSKHVRVLEQARLVQRRVTGRVHWCRLNAAPLKQVVDWSAGFREFWEARFQALDGLLEEMKQQEDAHVRQK